MYSQHGWFARQTVVYVRRICKLTHMIALNVLIRILKYAQNGHLAVVQMEYGEEKERAIE